MAGGFMLLIISSAKLKQRPPVQVPYYTGVDLATYFDRFKKCQWPVPVIKRCPICKGIGCAIYHGYYTRRVIDPPSGFSEDMFPVIRFRCRRYGKAQVFDHKTFSLLPLQLVPYRRLSLLFMLLAVYQWLGSRVSTLRTSSAIESCYWQHIDQVGYVYASALKLWRELLNEGVDRLFRVGASRMGLAELEKIVESERLNMSLELICGEKAGRTVARARSPDELVWRYHLMMGGDKGGGYFLFGRPSQERF